MRVRNVAAYAGPFSSRRQRIPARAVVSALGRLLFSVASIRPAREVTRAENRGHARSGASEDVTLAVTSIEAAAAGTAVPIRSQLMGPAFLTAGPTGALFVGSDASAVLDAAHHQRRRRRNAPVCVLNTSRFFFSLMFLKLYDVAICTMLSLDSVVRFCHFANENLCSSSL